LFLSKNRRLPVVNLVMLLTMLGGLLLGACGQADIALDFDGSNDQNGVGNLSETTLFALMIVLFITMVALVMVAGRS
jgi:hypothetical protein